MEPISYASKLTNSIMQKSYFKFLFLSDEELTLKTSAL